MATKRKTPSTRIRNLRERKLDAGQARKVRGGYIGETEKNRRQGALPCDGSSKDPA